MTTYADASDYATYKGLTFPGEWDEAEIARINAGLLSAQDDVELLVRFSVYDVDDADTQTALTRATCARFDWAETMGDDGSGAAGLYDSIGIGSVRLARSTSEAAASSRAQLAEQYGEKCLTILANASLITSVVYHS